MIKGAKLFYILHHFQAEQLLRIALNRWSGHPIRMRMVHFDRVSYIAYGNRHHSIRNIAMGKNLHHQMNVPKSMMLVVAKWTILMKKISLDNSEMRKKWKFLFLLANRLFFQEKWNLLLLINSLAIQSQAFSTLLAIFQ